VNARPLVGLVTGAGSGIGRATAYLLSERGYDVAVNDVDGDRAATVAAEVGGRPYTADVGDVDSVDEMVARIAREIGPVAVAVSNAGHYRETPIEEVTDAEWRRMLRVHLGGAFNVARSVVPEMRRFGTGSIVLVSSELALSGSGRAPAYAAAKAALIGLGRSLARELAPTVRVNVIAPGPVDTPLLAERERDPDAVASIPLGRLGRPEEIAAAIVHLAEATYTTGALYSPNGGTVIK
jgi:NAD(P)-dependent dehydrogenase (short-subunit alcohol dehydrogenase family)